MPCCAPASLDMEMENGPVCIVVTVRFVGGVLGLGLLCETLIWVVVELLTMTLRSGFHVKRLAFT